MRLRAKFSALREASQCGKKDRFNILESAVDKLREYQERLRRSEAALMRSSSTTNAHPTPAAAAADASSSTPSSSSSNSGIVVPSLSTPLNNFQFLNSLACCYISLDGRILDANTTFLRLFGFPPPTANVSSPAATQASPAGDLDTPTRGAAVASAPDIYSSSIFSVTHHGELIHTLSILRNLLCGVMDSFECAKTCVTTAGVPFASNITVAVVRSNRKTVMFLVIVVPKQLASTPQSTPQPTPQQHQADTTRVDSTQPPQPQQHDLVMGVSGMEDVGGPNASVPVPGGTQHNSSLPLPGKLHAQMSNGTPAPLPLHPHRAGAGMQPLLTVCLPQLQSSKTSPDFDHDCDASVLICLCSVLYCSSALFLFCQAALAIAATTSMGPNASSCLGSSFLN
jgi:hypothetical protein